MIDVGSIRDKNAFNTLIKEIDADGVRATFDVLWSYDGTVVAVQVPAVRQRSQAHRDEAYTLKGASASHPR